MSIVVGCPSCSSQLRVADNLLDRKVRCPACQTVFEASAVAEKSPQEQPAANEPSRSEGRERTSNKSDPAVPPAPFLGPIKLTLDDDEPARPSGRAATPDPNAPRGRAVRIPDDDEPPPKTSSFREELQDCPECGAQVHRDLSRCSRCGVSLKKARRFEEDEEEEERSRRKSRSRRREDDDDDDDFRLPVRRDCEPHRGGLILTLGIISLALNSCVGIIGIVPGLLAWIMGSSDLRKMKAGNMDPAGKGTTQAGWVCGIIGTCLGTLGLLACVAWFVFVIALENSKSNKPPTPRFGPPPNNPRKF